MSESVSLPALGESVTEGTVTRWLKNVGDHVEVDEPLLEVSTDKVDTEIPSPISGVIEAILVQEDETVEVGTALVTIGTGMPSAATPASAPVAEAPAAEAPTTGEPVAVPEPAGVQSVTAQSAPAEPATAESFSLPPAPVAPAQVPPQPAVPAAAVSTGPSHAASGYVTPIVRKLANEQGVDLATVTGTGVGGRIRKQDIVNTAAPAAPVIAPTAAAPVVTVSPLRGTTQPMSRLRKVVAERAVISMQSSAQLTSVVEVDVTVVAALRDRVKDAFLAATGTKLSFLPFFTLAAAEALRSYPVINATIEGDTIVYPDHENIAIAVDTDRGLLTPVVRDAGDLDIAGLSRQIADLATRTRDNRLKPDELAGGTFTVTNTGSRGALFDTPLVFLPQVAILGTGVVTKRPTIVSADGTDAIAIRSTVYLALSYDHRVVDGADAARFLVAVKDRLEQGAFEANLGI
ncbi:MAG: dihydrolipoamide succinyltransferase [Microbacteriaceae bacterium]|nr:MAG: dihydrolipoamide succinyltransferase [Microbacteriaceae bacterium]